MVGFEGKSALLTSSNTRAELQDIYDPIIRETLNSKSVFYNLVRREQNRGDYASWVLRTGRNSTYGSGGEQPDVAGGYAGRVKCTTAIKMQYAFPEVSDFMIAAQETAGVSREALFTEEVRLATEDLIGGGLDSASVKSGMNYQMFRDGTGNGSKNFLGLSAWVDDGTNNGGVATIAGVTRAATKPYMNAASIDTTSAALTEGYLRAMIDAVQTAGASMNDLLFVTTPALKTSVLNLMQPSQRFMTTDAKFGFRTLVNAPMFDDIPIYSDKDAESGKIYLLDMSTFALRTLKDVHYEDMGKTAASRKGKVAYYGELICYAPVKNAVCTTKT